MSPFELSWTAKKKYDSERFQGLVARLNLQNLWQSNYYSAKRILCQLNWLRLIKRRGNYVPIKNGFDQSNNGILRVVDTKRRNLKAYYLQRMK